MMLLRLANQSTQASHLFPSHHRCYGLCVGCCINLRRALWLHSKPWLHSSSRDGHPCEPFDYDIHIYTAEPQIYNTREPNKKHLFGGEPLGLFLVSDPKGQASCVYPFLIQHEGAEKRSDFVALLRMGSVGVLA